MRPSVEIYLVQHGESKAEAEDPQRPLSERGKAEVASIARNIASSEIEVGTIIHSGKLRARQTAELFAQYLSPPHGIREEKMLGPLDDPQEAEQLVEQAERPLMIVGHLPHLGRLASRLILGNTEQEMVRFRMGGVVCLSRSDGGWTIEWVLKPELIAK
jgi:phosphohistidine phosphatase